jgi:hypothetical protein
MAISPLYEDNMSTVNSVANIIPLNNFTITDGNLLMSNTNITGTSGIIELGGTRFISNYGVENCFVGEGSGNTTLTFADAGTNNGFGFITLSSLTTGADNNAVGCGTLSVLTTGVGNTGVGHGCLGALISGGGNTCLGATAGSSYTGAETNNICIGASVNGVLGESNVTRIGTGTTQTVVAGIFGVTVGVSGVPVVVDNTGQLGTVVSSIRFKDNIASMGCESKKILALRPVTFTYKSDKDKNKNYGLIAEEVKSVMPELVVNDTEGHVYSVKYQDLPVLLLNEVQRLVAKVNDLQKEIDTLRKR